MSAIAVDVLVALATVSAWIAALGFARLRSALDRLHCIAFVNVGCGVPIILAVFIADGASTRAFKLLFLFMIALVAGAAVNAAVARTIFTRDEAGERA